VQLTSKQFITKCRSSYSSYSMLHREVSVTFRWVNVQHFMLLL